jgi:hypothetical protein
VRHDGARNDPLVIGVGAESGQQVAGRAAVAVAERLGTPPVTFPGGHDGFAGGEYAVCASPTRSPAPCASS